ncbi:hypothetical protein Nos7524_1679 [Nostoc sp. PCC 7524]|uniref:hypothetical protein n=1 Tax=Nostoc sp. (strain ATCC 29411 / PCC 7524) TaxID=28072 RepID=UPI00029F2D77|nr:hypothetical protein [Nostoc sp. PCC 7524]AFY47551.1 hypothetical protein Nos7524_1679 [Nostoc sp. PCC 7524]
MVAEPLTPDTKQHPGLKELFNYPLMSAIAERRTRRLARGASISAGELSYTSPNQPEPLSPLEEAILVVSTGMTGITTHDGPLDKPEGGKELGTPFLNIIARSGSSADNCQATSFFMINDEGIWLIRRLKGREALAALGDLPPRWQDWSEEHWLKAAAAVKHRISDRRLDFPRDYPYYLGWNKQISNLPGTTLFFPVVDCTWQYINVLLILLSEPEGQKPLFIDDWQKFRPRTWADWKAWIGMHLGISPKIPYQPIGGIDRAQGGFVNPNNTVPLGLAHVMRTDHECFFLLQNLMLIGQAMGLGGWVHGAVFQPYILERNPAKEWYGLGFRMEPPTPKNNIWAPPPATQPNPVGIDGVLEGLCPPYVKSMDEAVDRVLEAKYGNQGAYGDKEVFARSYQNQSSAEAFLRKAEPHSKETIQYTKDICNYIYETYGRFPAHIDAFFVPGIWLQFSNLELEYYQKYYDPALFSRQAQHDELWGKQ